MDEKKISIITLDIVPTYNKLINSLRRLETPRNLKNQIIFVFAGYYNKNINFLYAIDSNHIGTSISYILSAGQINSLPIKNNIFPTNNINIKFILIPAPKKFTKENGIWELIIEDNHNNNIKDRFLFPTEYDLTFFYITKCFNNIYENCNFIKKHHYFNNKAITEISMTII